MKSYVIHGCIAAIVASGIVGGANFFHRPTVVAASKHAWPALDDAEKAALTEVAKTLPKGIKIDIVCNDAGCSDLAADIDDALEDAGIESTLDKAIGPLGYGVGVQVNEFDRPAAEQAIEMLKRATNDRLAPTVVAGKSPPGYVTILIGKRPR